MRENHKSAFDEILFEHRNKNYGAYVLRRSYKRHLLIASAVGLVFFLAIVFFDDIHKWIKGEKELDTTKPYHVVPVDLMNPEVIKVPEPPKEEPPSRESQTKPPPEKKPKPPRQVTANTPVKVVEKNEDPVIIADSTTKGATTPGDSIKNQIPPKKDTIAQETRRVPPSYFNDEQAIYAYLLRNVVYPQAAREKLIQGTVVVSLYIDTLGHVESPAIVSGIGYGCDEETLRVIGNMPSWTPGKINGRPARMKVTLPVRFRLN